MSDGWEVKYGLDPVFDDAQEDLDWDGYTNIEEYNSHTDPCDFHPNLEICMIALLITPVWKMGKPIQTTGRLTEMI